MEEAVLRAIIFVTLKNHAYNHRGTCECGQFVGAKPDEVLLHIELKLTEKIMERQKEELNRA